MGSPTLRRPGSRIDHCDSCGAALPLRAAEGKEGRKWVCCCGREFIAQLDRGYSIEELRNVHPEPVAFDRHLLTPVPDEVMEFIRTKVNNVEPKIVEKRTSFRHQVILQLPALPLDQMLRPEGAPFVTTTRDLSTSGIGLIHTRAITNRFLVLELATPSGDPIQVLMEVLRCRPRGPYHDVAGQFVTKMATSPSPPVDTKE